MPQLIAAPTQIPVPGNKIIDEYIGRLNSGDTQASIAHMRSPAGWSEPGQRPDFDEYTIVLKGVMRVEHEAGVTEVKAGQAIIAQRRVGSLQHSRWRRIHGDLRSGVHAGYSTPRRLTLLLFVNLRAAVVHAVDRALRSHSKNLAAA